MKPTHLLPLLALLALSACNNDPLRTAAYNEGAAYYQAKHYDLALPKLREAAKAGNADAQLLLGKCYDFGYGVPANVTQAASWYTAAANSGNANAQDNLGTCYATGSGVPKNLPKAVQLYRQAAAQNNASALNNLGLCYRNGEGVAEDPAIAADYFRRAADLGNANGQYNLGRCYFHGIGVPNADLEQARLWISKAAAQGHKNAIGFMEDNGWQP